MQRDKPQMKQVKTGYLATGLAAILLMQLACSSTAADRVQPEAVTGADAPPRSVEQRQQDFLDLKFGMFIHYNMATYQGVQWVPGYPSPAEFDPGVETIDTDAWAQAAVAAGMKYAVLTVKHVSGFCLWDSKYTTYDVMHPDCPYQQDLVAQFIESCTKVGLKVGLYYCWRSPGFEDKYKVLPPECDPDTHTFEQQIAFQKAQIAELVEKYPEAFYIWNDGLDDTIMTREQANAFIRSLGPGVIASGNWWDWDKKGQPFLDIAIQELKPISEANAYPAETCWTLEQNWFWLPGFEPKEPQAIVDLLQQSNAQNSNFLLNVAPDRRGQIGDESIKTLADIGRLNGLAGEAK